jgi:hypothetical protein
MPMERFTPISFLPAMNQQQMSVASLGDGTANNSTTGAQQQRASNGVVVGVPAPLTQREMEQLYLPINMLHPSLIPMGVPTPMMLPVAPLATMIKAETSAVAPRANHVNNNKTTSSASSSSASSSVSRLVQAKKNKQVKHEQNSHDDDSDDGAPASPNNSSTISSSLVTMVEKNARKAALARERRRQRDQQRRGNGSASDSDHTPVSTTTTTPAKITNGDGSANTSEVNSDGETVKKSNKVSSKKNRGDTPRRTINGRIVKPRRNLGSRKRGTSCRAMFGREREQRDQWCQGCRNNWKCQRDLTEDEIVASLRTYQRPKKDDTDDHNGSINFCSILHSFTLTHISIVMMIDDEDDDGNNDGSREQQPPPRRRVKLPAKLKDAATDDNWSEHSDDSRSDRDTRRSTTNTATNDQPQQTEEATTPTSATSASSSSSSSRSRRPERITSKQQSSTNNSATTDDASSSHWSNKPVLVAASRAGQPRQMERVSDVAPPLQGDPSFDRYHMFNVRRESSQTILDDLAYLSNCVSVSSLAPLSVYTVLLDCHVVAVVIVGAS